jgi:hypothetical protein
LAEVHPCHHNLALQKALELNKVQEEEAFIGLDVGGTYFHSTAKPRSKFSNYVNRIGTPFSNDRRCTTEVLQFLILFNPV